jgi:hypothetical protein
MLRKVYCIAVILIAFLMCATTLTIADSNEPSEPIYEYEYHIEKPLQIIINHQGSFSIDFYLEVYEEPQEGESEGLDYGYEIKWDEPLYYKGSTKEIWLTYDGYGIYIIIQGPDMGFNSDTYIEIRLRHVNVFLEIHISTGIIPV